VPQEPVIGFDKKCAPFVGQLDHSGSEGLGFHVCRVQTALWARLLLDARPLPPFTSRGTQFFEVVRLLASGF
jgi:hypothetical protein